MSTETQPATTESSPSLPAAAPSRFRLVPAILLSSVGSVLFSLAIFRLLSFFIMPSMFFSLLLVGFPIGAALVARQRSPDAKHFRLLLAMLEGVMILSILGTLLGKHVNYLRAQLLFGVDPDKLLIQVLIFSLLYLPFFIAYGAAEFVGYLAGTSAFGQRMRPVYGLFLLGGAAAFALAAGLQRPLGVPRLLVLAVGMVALGRLFLLDRLRWRSAPELVVLAGLACWPAFDATFMSSFKSSEEVAMSAANSLKNFNRKVAFAGWGKYSYVEIHQESLPDNPLKVKSLYTGFYNDVNMWQYAPMPAVPDFAALPPQFLVFFLHERMLTLFSPGQSGSVAVVGSGGGREAAQARRAGVGRILALEIEPGVVEAIRGTLHDGFNEVYSADPVEVHVGEARSYFERTREQFDVIMLMSVGSYPQLMLEPGAMIRTTEAFNTFVDHLTPNGVLVIGYDKALDKKAVLLRQYNRTLRDLGMETHGYVVGEVNYLLLANRSDVSVEQKVRLENAWRQLAITPDVYPFSEDELHLPGFRHITDDRPYLAGNVRNILSEGQIWRMALVMAALMGLVGLSLAAYFRRGLVRQHCPVRPAAMLGLAFLVGVNFMLIEQLCVIQLFRRLYDYYEALILGVVAFLTITGLGSLLVPKGKLASALAGALVLALVWWWGFAAVADLAAVALLAPAVLATGTFFPVLFEQIPMSRLALFAMDAVGAAAGGLVAFFVPMLFGFQAFTAVAMGGFFVTSSALLLFLNSVKGESALGGPGGAGPMTN